MTQVTLGTEIILKAIEGDWFRIQLPPDPRLGGARVEAYVSKKVAKIVMLPTAAPAVTGPKPPDHPERRDGMSVAMVVGTSTTWLVPETTRLRIVTETAASPRALASVLPMADPPLPTTPAPVTFAWTIGGASSANALDDKRPMFVVQFKDVPGFPSADLMPTLIRIAPAVSGARVLSVVRGTMELTARTDADWDVMKDLKQDVIRATVAVPEPGAARLQPDVALVPGEYAIVLRPVATKRYAGATVFDGPIFTTAWTFSTK